VRSVCVSAYDASKWPGLRRPLSLRCPRAGLLRWIGSWMVSRGEELHWAVRPAELPYGSGLRNNETIGRFWLLIFGT